ncbi:MAG: T9SS type A sorting domain-containing protein [Saprospiraceae bacterium]|nr:T9SS type A sorting domain-containing protein [Saprospiraceae bacterium]
MKRTLLLAIFLSVGLMAFSQNRSKKWSATQSSKDLVELKLFPNPATNYIGINGNVDAVKTLKIFNLVGKEMKSYKVTEGATYFVGDLVKGLYLIQLTDKKGKALTTQRVSKR